MKYPISLEKLIKSFSAYPGIGPKTAERLAFYTLTKMDKNSALDFSHAIEDAVLNMRKCRVCRMISDSEVCDICKDKKRDDTILVVEESKDVLSFEHLEVYKGKYHVLDGLISPMRGVGPEDINLDKLLERVKEENIKEVIIALSSTIPGETTALYIKKILENEGVDVYKIGYGLPVGANLEYVDEITLIKSLEGKRKL